MRMEALERILPVGRAPARFDFCNLPTPVEKHGLKDCVLYIKRDDLISKEYSGNKTRKLEYTLADACSQEKKIINTVGAIGSNHCLATATFSRKIGLACRLFLFQQPVTEHVRMTLSMYQKLGAEILYRGSYAKTFSNFYLNSLVAGKTEYHLPAGGSSAIGNLGFVNAALELRDQVEAGEIPQPDYLVVATGSMGTTAGLSVGLKLAGLATKIKAVRVIDRHYGPLPVVTEGTLLRKCRQLTGYLRTNLGLSIESGGNTDLMHDYFGKGYGYETPEGLKAMQIMRKLDLSCETTYSAKAFAAALDLARKEKMKTVLYWHTLNSVKFDMEDSDSRLQLLPADLKKIFSLPEGSRR